MPTPNEARVLRAMHGKDAHRYTDIEDATGLQATQVSRALKALVRDHLVLALTLGDGRLPIKRRYRLSKQGQIMVQALLAYESALAKGSAALTRAGDSVERQRFLDAQYKVAKEMKAGKEPSRMI